MAEILKMPCGWSPPVGSDGRCWSQPETGHRPRSVGPGLAREADEAKR